jgi:hypothetical protein
VTTKRRHRQAGAAFPIRHPASPGAAGASRSKRALCWSSLRNRRANSVIARQSNFDHQIGHLALNAKAKRAAAAYLRDNLGRGTTIERFLGNTPDHPINFFGARVCALPLFHIYELTLILMKRLRYGDLISLQQRFDLYEIIRYIEVKRATVFPGVPTIWIAIISLPDLDSRDLSSLV